MTPALIVMDRVLRDGDGWELVRVLKTLSSTAKVPVIALATDASPRHFMRALLIGCDAILSRRSEPDALLREIRRLLVGPDADYQITVRKPTTAC